MNDELINIKKTAGNYASGRCAMVGKNTKFKVNQTVFKDELTTACIYGELSALERMLIFIQNQDKIEKDELEAALHLSIVNLNNYVSEKIGRRGAKIKVDDYLELRGYYEKGSPLDAKLDL